MLRTFERSVHFTWDKGERVGVEMCFNTNIWFEGLSSKLPELWFRDLCHS